MAAENLLDLLRARSTVDCDTLDWSVVASLGPFEDCTSNQAIALYELRQQRHEKLLRNSAVLARELVTQYPDVSLVSLAVEVAMVQLGLQMAAHITGCVHVQTNPFTAYSTSRTIASALRIVSLFRYLDPGFEASRLCVKIPATWEGLQACRLIQIEGVNTLATTLFTIEQAALAGEVGCRYIAPYVNELKVHFESGHVDVDPNFSLCVEAQKYYEQNGLKTTVLTASLTSVKDCMALAGVRHITVNPVLLQELKATRADEVEASHYPSQFDEEKIELPEELSFANDEEKFRMAVTRNGKGKNETKLIQAINIFCDIQLKLEEMMTPLLGS